MKIIQRDIVKAIVESKGYKLTSDLNIFGEKTRFIVHCPIHNFEWESSYWTFKYSSGACRLCSSNAVSYADLKALVESKNGTVIKRITRSSKDPRNIIVRCNKHNKEFKTRLVDIKRGIWCNECAIEDRKITYKQVEELVKSKGGTLLTKGCSTATMLFNVRCEAVGCGREWQTSYARISQGCWCPRCAGFDRYTYEEVKQLLGTRGELLTTDIQNAQQKISVKCKCGNTFDMAIYNIARGCWCQACAEGQSKQRYIHSVICELFPGKEVRYDYYGFDWLKDKSTLELDIWIPHLKLAIEYDGEQHYKPVKFASTMTDEQATKAFEITQAHDRLKDLLIAQHPEDVAYFLRFKYDELITRGYVIERLRDKGIK